MVSKHNISILSISQYGSDLASIGARLSGALERQKDYAQYVEKYIVLVPTAKAAGAPTLYDGGLEIHTVHATNVFTFFIAAYLKACTLHRAHTFDVLMVDNPHIGGILGVLLKWRLGVPLVIHSMADMLYNEWYNRERVLNHVKQLLMRVSVRYANVLRVSTQTEVRRLIAHNITAEKLAYVPFYIDGPKFQAELTQTSAEQKPMQILCVGRLSYQKDVGTLLKAFKEVVAACPDATLVLAGSGSLRTVLEREATTLGIASQVTFTGAIPYTEISRFFKESAVFALSSLYEGTCMVLHEAATAGLPIVSTDNAGAQDFITNDGIGGTLVPVHDHHALAHALIKMLTDGTFHTECSRRAETRVGAFSRTAALEHWNNLCERLVVLSTKDKKVVKPT